MKSPWHPLIGDPNSALDDAELDNLRSSRESALAGSPGDVRSPKAFTSTVRGDAGERTTLVGTRWFEEDPEGLSAEHAKPPPDLIPPKAAPPAAKPRTLRSLVVAMLRAALAVLDDER